VRTLSSLFASLDPELREGRPLFVALATISNHQPFTEMPPDQERLYSAPVTFNENFQNSIHLADGYLRAFFGELETRGLLEKSLVILLGDHGMVTGLDGNVSNEKSASASLFRIPLFVFWQGRSWRNGAIAYSQLDLAPSILEWLGISADAHFAGEVIPAEAESLPREQHLIPLVQPYDGIFLMSLLYPYKYGYNTA